MRELDVLRRTAEVMESNDPSSVSVYFSMSIATPVEDDRRDALDLLAEYVGDVCDWDDDNSTARKIADLIAIADADPAVKVEL